MSDANVFPPQPKEFTPIFDQLRARPDGFAFGELGEPESAYLAVAQATFPQPDIQQILAATASPDGQFLTGYFAQLGSGGVLTGIARDARQHGHGLDLENPVFLLQAFQGKTFSTARRARSRSIFDKLVEITTQLLDQ